MRTNAEGPGVLYLGKQGETQAREVAFRIPASWRKEFGTGVAQLLVSPPGHGRTYPVILEEAEGVAVWRVTAADTARPGYGRCELRWSVEGRVVKSRVYTTYVAQSLGGGGCGDDSWGRYLEEITRAGADALAAAGRAENAAFHGPVIRDGSWWVWDPAEDGYADTGVRAAGEGGWTLDKDSLGHNLTVEDGKLTVLTTDDFSGDNTLPMTAAGVETVVGNIEILLKIIREV